MKQEGKYYILYQQAPSLWAVSVTKSMTTVKLHYNRYDPPRELQVPAGHTRISSFLTAGHSKLVPSLGTAPDQSSAWRYTIT